MTTMPARQYAAARKKLGLSHRQAALLLGTNIRQSFRYESGEADVPKIVAKFLRLMIRYGVKPEDVE